MAYRLCDGYSVNAGYFTATTLLKGTFNSSTENFSPKKHSVLFLFNHGESLRKEFSTIEVEILGVAGSSITIAQVLDVKSGLVNNIFVDEKQVKTLRLIISS